MSLVIDVHTHMYTQKWLELLRRYGGPDLEVKESLDSPNTVFYRGASFCVLEDPHFDYGLRIKNMDKAGVDLAVITMPAPSVFWGGPDHSLNAAQTANNEFAEAQSKYPDRICWMASLPWEYPDFAVKELERVCELGAVGVLTLGNINGKHLTDELFTPIWEAIDKRGLPVLLHPTYPPGIDELGLTQYAMVASIGFMVDTSTAVIRMIGDGFFDRFSNLKLIAAHAGGTLPYLAGRLDQVFNKTKRARVNIDRPPSEYLQHIYYDAVTYRQESLEMCVQVGSEDRVMYGSDYPFNIGDMVGCLDRVNKLTGTARDKVRGDNAARIFGL
jgi:aminocarboxymuconate-semialdehyde decarboxylase